AEYGAFVARLGDVDDHLRQEVAVLDEIDRFAYERSPYPVGVVRGDVFDRGHVHVHGRASPSKEVRTRAAATSAAASTLTIRRAARPSPYGEARRAIAPYSWSSPSSRCASRVIESKSVPTSRATPAARASGRSVS